MEDIIVDINDQRPFTIGFVGENEVLNLYKLENSVLHRAPRTLRYENGQLTCNPTDSQLIDAGFFPLVDDPLPKYDEATQYLAEIFIQETHQIRRAWIIKEILGDVYEFN